MGSMASNLGIYAYIVKAQMHTPSTYHCPMNKVRNLREILAINVLTLKSARNLSQTKIAKMSGGAMDQTTVGRIERMQIATTVDMIDGLARAFELEPWQLLTPNLDPKNPPILREPTREERELWKKLTESAKQLGLTQ